MKKTILESKKSLTADLARIGNQKVRLVRCYFSDEIDEAPFHLQICALDEEQRRASDRLDRFIKEEDDALL